MKIGRKDCRSQKGHDLGRPINVSLFPPCLKVREFGVDQNC